VALDILERVAEGGLSFAAILGAARQAAIDGTAGQALLGAWRQLPVESRMALRNSCSGAR